MDSIIARRRGFRRQKQSCARLFWTIPADDIIVPVEEKLKFAVFVDYDNIEIGVRTTLHRDLDIEIVLEGVAQRGEIVSKVAYGNWGHHIDATRAFSAFGVQMVQRDSTPRGDKNGADINLALDALEMAFTRDHINAFAIISGDSDFMSLVNKLKQYNKRVYIVGGKQFTSSILQRNCHEFISYESLLDILPARQRRGRGRGSAPPRASQPISQALRLLDRTLNALEVRGVQPQLGLLKSTMQQLDPAFSERDYGVSTFSAFVKKLQDKGYVQLRQVDNHQVVERSGEDDGEAPEETAAPPKPSRRKRSRRSPRAETEPAPAADLDADLEPPEPLAVSDEPLEDEPPPPPEVELPDGPEGRLMRLLGPHRELLTMGIPQKEVVALIRAGDPDFDPRDLNFEDFADLLAFAEEKQLLESRLDARDSLRYFPGDDLIELPETPAADGERGGPKRSRRRRRRAGGSRRREGVSDVAGEAAASSEEPGPDSEPAAVEEPADDEPAPKAAKKAVARRKTTKKVAKKTVKKVVRKRKVAKKAADFAPEED